MNTELTVEELQVYKIIELSVNIQRSIEILDDLEELKHPFSNKKLNSQLKGVYGPLDKQTKLYNEFYNSNPTITNHFYEVVKANAKFITSFNLLDQSRINNYLEARVINTGSVEGIVTKILKGNK